MKFFAHPDCAGYYEDVTLLEPSENAQIEAEDILILPYRAAHSLYPLVRPHQFALSRTVPKMGVSKCLLGINCRYDGGSKQQDVSNVVMDREVVGICPEQFGGLPTPREPASLHFENGVIRVLANTTKRDVTAEYNLGASESLALLEREGVVAVVLKKRSPSCDCTQTWGVTARLLKAEGFCLISSPE